MPFEFTPLKIPEVLLIVPKVFGDPRGFFLEVYKASDFHNGGIHLDFLQDSHSKSQKGVLRGLHYQINPKAQGKLLRCIRGTIFDVAVDIRKNSPHYGKWVGEELSEENKKMLWVPPGFAHGFIALEDGTEVIYKTTGEYAPEMDRGIRWNDPDIGVEWPSIPQVLSEKDQESPYLKDAENNFEYTGD